MKKSEILAVYLTVMALLQLGLYFVSFGRESTGALLYLDPRLGIDAWLTGGKMSAEARSNMTVLSQGIRWVAAGWILILGLLLAFRKPIVQLYVLSECLLSIPNLVFFGLVLLVSVGSSHGFATGELFVPLVIFTLYTIVPMSIALRGRKAAIERNELEG